MATVLLRYLFSLQNGVDEVAYENSADDPPHVTRKVSRKFDKQDFAVVHNVGKVQGRLTLADNMLNLIKVSELVQAALSRCNFLTLIVLTHPVKGMVPEAHDFRPNGRILQEVVAELFLFQKRRNLRYCIALI